MLYHSIWSIFVITFALSVQFVLMPLKEGDVRKAKEWCLSLSIVCIILAFIILSYGVIAPMILLFSMLVQAAAILFLIVYMKLR